MDLVLSERTLPRNDASPLLGCDGFLLLSEVRVSAAVEPPRLTDVPVRLLRGYAYPSSRGAMPTCDRVLLAPYSVAAAQAPAVTVLWKRADPAIPSTGSLARGTTFTTTLSDGATPSVLQMASSLTQLAAPSSEPFYGPLDFNDSSTDTGTGIPLQPNQVQDEGVSSLTPSPSAGAGASSGVPFGVGLAISIIVPVVIITMIALALLLYRRRRLRESKAARPPTPPPSAPRGEAFHELHAEDIPIPPDHTPTAWIPRLPIELLAPKAVDDVDTTIRRLRSERERVREHLQRLRMMEELEAEERRLEQELQDRLD